MRKLKPRQYINEFYPDSGLTTQTIRNWLANGNLVGERTPTGQWLVVLADNAPEERVKHLLQLMEA